MSTFQFKLKTPLADLLFSTEVSSLTFASESGEMQVLSGHESMTAGINFSPLKIVFADGREDSYLLRNGLFLFDNENNSASILALHAEEKSRVDLKSLEEYMEFLKEQLAQGHSLSEFQVKYLSGEKLALESQIGA